MVDRLVKLVFVLTWCTACALEPGSGPFEDFEGFADDDAYDSPGAAVDGGHGPIDVDDNPEGDFEDGAEDSDGDGTSDPVPGTSDDGRLRVFITSTRRSGNLGGVQGADAWCNDEAHAAELGGHWIAWVSAANSDAIDRVVGDGPWVDLAGQVVFNNTSHLKLAPLVPILLDSFGAEHRSEDVWTGTGAGGRLVGATCSGWSTADWAQIGVAGSNGGGESWTATWELPCDWPARLYCLESEV